MKKTSNRQAKHKIFSSCHKYYKRIKQHVKTENQKQAHGEFYLEGGSGQTSLRKQSQDPKDEEHPLCEDWS